MKIAIKNILKSFGYQLNPIYSNKGLNLDNSGFSNAAIDLVKSNTMLSTIKLATLYEQVVHFEKNNLAGDLVECGVWKGGSVGIMAKANLDHSQKRRDLHLFDSFTDICEPDPNIDGETAVNDVKTLLNVDTIQLSGKLTPIEGVYESRGGHGTIRECEDLLLTKVGYPKEFIHFHKGWFQDTLTQNDLKINKIAILRLDADWYESTKICLEKLYDLVIPGGLVIIDDYGRYDGCKKAVDDFLNSIGKNVFLDYSDPQNAECRYFFK